MIFRQAHGKLGHHEIVEEKYSVSLPDIEIKDLGDLLKYVEESGDVVIRGSQYITGYWQLTTLVI